MSSVSTKISTGRRQTPARLISRVLVCVVFLPASFYVGLYYSTFLPLNAQPVFTNALYVYQIAALWSLFPDAKDAIRRVIGKP